jgi:hypothetical protein
MLMEGSKYPNPRHSKCSDDCVYAEEYDSDDYHSPIFGPFLGSWQEIVAFSLKSNHHERSLESPTATEVPVKQVAVVTPTTDANSQHSGHDSAEKMASFNNRMHKLALAGKPSEPKLKTVKRLPVVYAKFEPPTPLKAELCEASVTTSVASSKAEVSSASKPEAREMPGCDLPIVYAIIKPLPSSRLRTLTRR